MDWASFHSPPVPVHPNTYTDAEMTSRPPPPAEPLDDDDLLAEILLRLPPDPSSLPRASAVCRRWRGVASDPRFSRRFRAHHRRSPPLIGCFVEESHCAIHFAPVLEAPNCVTRGRFSVPIDDASRGRFRPLGCRHGLVLLFDAPGKKLLVWDPVSGEQHRLDVPPGVACGIHSTSAAVLRPAPTGKDDAPRRFHFQVVLVGTSDKQHTQLVASVYSSETRRWGGLVSTQIRSNVNWVYYADVPAVMVGGSLYWKLAAGNGILEFDLDTHSLTLIPIPKEITGRWHGAGQVWVLPAHDGGLGFLFVSGFTAQLWKKRKTLDCCRDGGVASWVLDTTIALDTLLSMNSGREPFVLGFAEENNMDLLWTSIGVFTVRLESLEFNKLFQAPAWYHFYPFESVYLCCRQEEH